MVKVTLAQNKKMPAKKDVGKSNVSSRKPSTSNKSEVQPLKPRDVLMASLHKSTPEPRPTRRKTSREDDDDPEWHPSSPPPNQRRNRSRIADEDRRTGRESAQGNRPTDHEEQEDDGEDSDEPSDEEGEAESEQVQDEVENDVEVHLEEEDVETDNEDGASLQRPLNEPQRRRQQTASKLPTVPGLTEKEIDWLAREVTNGEHSFLATCGEFVAEDVVEGFI